MSFIREKCTGFRRSPGKCTMPKSGPVYYELNNSSGKIKTVRGYTPVGWTTEARLLVFPSPLKEKLNFVGHPACLTKHYFPTNR